MKSPTRRAVGHTRPQPPKSNGLANGHEKVPKGPKDKTAAAPVAEAPAAEAPAAEVPAANGKGPKK